MELGKAYIWLDYIKKEFVEDVAPDEYFKALELAQQLIREKVTGIAE